MNFDGNLMDAFYRLRVSEPETLFEAQQQYDVQANLYNIKKSANGSETHLPNEGCSSLAVTNGNGEYIIKQSKKYLRYQPGKSLLIFITAAFGTTPTNCSKKIGYFDTNNGFFLENLGGEFYICKRSYVTGSAVDTKIAMRNWDNYNNPSINNLDPSKAHIFWVDVEWLGVGAVRTGFVIDGVPIVAHTFRHANLITTSYATSMNLPIRYEIINNAATAVASSFKAICCSVMSEGGYDEVREFPCTISNGVTAIGVTTRRPILSIRPATTFNSITNRILNEVNKVAVRATGNDAYAELVYNPTSITNASFGAVDSTYSGMQYDISGTAISGGSTVLSFPVTAGTITSIDKRNLLSALPLATDVDGTGGQIMLSIVATSFTGTSNCIGVFNWSEFR